MHIICNDLRYIQSVPALTLITPFCTEPDKTEITGRLSILPSIFTVTNGWLVDEITQFGARNGFAPQSIQRNINITKR